jgi:hypothetical protein
LFCGSDLCIEPQQRLTTIGEKTEGNERRGICFLTLGDHDHDADEDVEEEDVAAVALSVLARENVEVEDEAEAEVVSEFVVGGASDEAATVRECGLST